MLKNPAKIFLNLYPDSRGGWLPKFNVIFQFSRKSDQQFLYVKLLPDRQTTMWVVCLSVCRDSLKHNCLGRDLKYSEHVRVRPILASGTRYRYRYRKKMLRYQPRYCTHVTKTIVLCFDCAHQRKKQHPSALKCPANRSALHHNHSWTPQCHGH